MKRRTISDLILVTAVAVSALILVAAVTPSSAHARTATKVGISASSDRATIQRGVVIRGRLTTASGRPLGGRTLLLESRPPGTYKWTRVTKAKTNSSGRVSRSVRPQYKRLYRYRYVGSSKYRPNKSTAKVISGHRYALKFSESFSGTRLSTATWTPTMQWGPRTTGQLQVYTPSALKVDNGRLTITAQRRSPTRSDPSRFTSGVVSAHGRGQYRFKYGYIETRVKIPRGNGLWAAVWLLPLNPDTKAEIDVVETRGQEPRINHMTLHYGDEQVKRVYVGPDFSAKFHTFAVKWNRDRVTWYVDGIERYRVTNRSQIPDVYMYPLANLQIGDWGGTPYSSTRFPKRFQIDYIRIYQHN